MADQTTAVQTDDLPDVPDVSLVDTPIASRSEVEAAQAAEQGTDNAAAGQEQAKTDDTTATSDAKATEATDQKPSDKAADQKPEGEQQTDEQKAQEQTAQQQQGPAQSKEQREAAAAKAWQDRQRVKQNVANKVDEVYGPKTKDQLVKEGLTPEQAEVQALREEVAFNNRKAQIAEMNATLNMEAVNVMNEFPVFNPNRPDEYDENFTKQVQDAYAIAARLQTDENGIVLNAEVPLYDFYQRMANIYSRGATKGSQQGQADMAEMMSRTEPVGSSSSAGVKGEESLEDMEARLGDVAIA